MARKGLRFSSRDSKDGNVSSEAMLVAAKPLNGARTDDVLQLATIAANLGIWEWDCYSGEVTWNEQMFELHGADRDEFTGTYNDWRRTILREDVEHAERAVQRALEGNLPYRCEYRVRHGDGDVRWIEACGTVLFDGYGRPRRAIGVNWDVTEFKRVEQRLRESRSFLEQTQHVAGIGSWVSSLGPDRALWWSRQMYRMFGIAEETAIDNETFFSAIHPDDRSAIDKAVQRAIATRTPYSIEHRVRWPDGTERWIYVRAEVVFGQNDKPLQLVGVAQDVTERRRTEEAVRLAAKVFECSNEAIFIADSERRFVQVNQTFTDMTGYRNDEVKGQPVSVMDSAAREWTLGSFWSSLDQQGSWRGESLERRKDGTEFPVWLTLAVDRDAQGGVAHYIGTFSDITRFKESQQRLQYLANYDALTALPNRTMFYDRLMSALKSAERDHYKVAVMFIDLDEFKIVNDTLGHQVGDTLLKAVAKRLKGVTRGKDSVCRLGGDEFTVLLEHIVSPEEVARMAQRILDTLAPPVTLEGHDIVMSASIGISLFPDDARESDALIRNADTAMFKAKEHGRNVYKFFTEEMNTEVSRRLYLESQLRRALERNELFLLYQPQVQMPQRRIVGFEALIRWQHPEFGMVPPSQFIPIAEASGLILPIGEWVMQEVIAQSAKWADEGLSPLRLSVNLSARQFRQKDIVGTIERIMRQHPPSMTLELEITETAVMENAESSVKTLSQLKELGLTLAVDDFGIGYSSLAYLKRFPVDRLKIDQTFVHGISEGSDDAAIVSAITSLAHSLDIRVVAEGVETEAQLGFVNGSLCDEVQGYLFSKAIRPERVPALLQDWNGTR